MAYEVLTAFFLEAGFLGVMLFGLERVGHRLHFLATSMVAIGTLFSAFWILSANSWMQTPTGYAINADGQFVAADWLKVIFNPSFPYRLVHMVLAAYLTTALVVGAVGAFHLWRDQHLPGPRVMFTMAMWMATLVAPIQILAGDQHGLNTLEHQPTKIMAMEGHYKSHKNGAPLILFGLPDQAAGEVKYALEIPKLGSLILKHSLDAPMAGLDTVPRENWPPVPITFWSFRIMVGLGFLMLGLGLFSLWNRWRGTLYQSRLLHMFAMAMGPAGFLAVLAGWITTETGRQPFTVYGLLRTVEVGVAFGGARGRLFADRFCDRLFRGVFRRRDLYSAIDGGAAASRRTGTAWRYPRPCRRDYARGQCGSGRGCVMATSIDIATIWAFIIAFAVFVYVVMDGFDLGLGILFPLFPNKADRDVIMNSVAPVWDGNETWLVLGGGGMMAAFPLAYAVLMPALYTPIITMLIGLIFRGVAFEFRWRTTQSGRNRWDLAFAGGSLLAALAQGIALGAILQGIHVDGRHYAGGWWDWLTPFSILTGVALAIGYALLGATWLVLKTEGELRDKAYGLSWFLLFAMLASIGAVSIATPFLHVQYAQRWFTWPNVVLTAPVPIAVAAVAVMLLRSLASKQDYQPFFLSLALFALSYAGLGISMWPYIVPQSITIWQAASPENSQVFMLVGVAVLVPLILGYTAWAYWVFRGKVRPESGYH